MSCRIHKETKVFIGAENKWNEERRYFLDRTEEDSTSIFPERIECVELSLDTARNSK